MAPFSNVMEFLDERAPVFLNHYYNSGCFTGAHFGSHACGGDRSETRNRFTDDDVVAVKLLGVDIPPGATLELLTARTDDLTKLLVDIPYDISLASPQAKKLIMAGSPASRLYAALDGIDGVGDVTAHKLLARKRPHLLPVFDSVVGDALLPPQEAVWEPLWETLQNPVVTTRLQQLHAGLGRSDVPLLRIFDVSIWMRHFRTWLQRHRPKVTPHDPCGCLGVY
jgi:hypothetical protein